MKKKTLFFSAPLHNGMVESGFFCSCIDLDRRLRDLDIPLSFYFNQGESLVQRSRNNIANTFLNSVCSETGEPWTHLVMMDNDMGFEAWQVEEMLALADDDHWIIGGSAPVKAINWRKVHDAAKAGASIDEIKSAGSRMVVNKLDDWEDDGSSLIPVKYCGTGFILIDRRALQVFAENYPELWYKPDYKIGSPEFDNQDEVVAFFDCMICPESKRYLSEDFTFCHRMKEVGVWTYLCREAIVSHVGKYEFRPHQI